MWENAEGIRVHGLVGRSPGLGLGWKGSVVKSGTISSSCFLRTANLGLIYIRSEIENSPSAFIVAGCLGGGNKTVSWWRDPLRIHRFRQDIKTTVFPIGIPWEVTVRGKAMADHSPGGIPCRGSLPWGETYKTESRPFGLLWRGRHSRSHRGILSG